jgi:DNA-binding IclR family transcriptional regulator
LIQLLPDLAPFSEATPEAAELRRALETIRRTGFATSGGEFVPEAIAVACPVLRDGSCMCSLSVAATSRRGDGAWQRNAKEALARARRQVESLI